MGIRPGLAKSAYTGTNSGSSGGGGGGTPFFGSPVQTIFLDNGSHGAATYFSILSGLSYGTPVWRAAAQIPGASVLIYFPVDIEPTVTDDISIVATMYNGVTFGGLFSFTNIPSTQYGKALIECLVTCFDAGGGLVNFNAITTLMTTALTPIASQYQSNLFTAFTPADMTIDILAAFGADDSSGANVTQSPYYMQLLAKPNTMPVPSATPSSRIFWNAGASKIITGTPGVSVNMLTASTSGSNDVPLAKQTANTSIKWTLPLSYVNDLVGGSSGQLVTVTVNGTYLFQKAFTSVQDTDILEIFLSIDNPAANLTWVAKWGSNFDAAVQTGSTPLPGASLVFAAVVSQSLATDTMTVLPWSIAYFDRGAAL